MSFEKHYVEVDADLPGSEYGHEGLEMERKCGKFIIQIFQLCESEN